MGTVLNLYNIERAALVASMRHAYRNRQQTTIGGAIFEREEMKAAALELEAFPDLLAVLESIENTADNAKDQPRRQTGALFDIMEAARDAIAKARGE